MSDLYTALYMQEADSVTARQAKAKVAALAIARETIVPFVKTATTQRERELRLDIAEGDLKVMVDKEAALHDVDARDIYQEIFQKVAADVAVTKPKTVDLESDIGGAEGKKYQDTNGLGDGAPDATTPIVDPDPMKNDEPVEPVVLKPKRHKLVENTNMDSAKENTHSKPSGESVDFHSKVAGPEDVAGFAGAISDDPHGVAEILEGVIAELESHPQSTPGLLERVQSLHDRIKPDQSVEELSKRREVWRGQVGGPQGWTPMGPKAVGRRPGGPRGGKV